MMNENMFDPMHFYSSYPKTVISRPGYPARAVFKSTLMFSLYWKYILDKIGKIATYADIGGCFGFGAHAMGFHISNWQGIWPRTIVFEIASEFSIIGKTIFPHIEFVEADFRQWNGDVKVFDLITLFDIVEHVVDPESFLQHVSAHSRYVMLKTPMETSGEWRGSKPPANVGEKHPDGHINFFSPKTYEKLLNKCNFDIIQYRLLPTIVPDGARMVLLPEDLEKPVAKSLACRTKEFVKKMASRCVPYRLARKIVGGGDHICLCRSRLCN